jgi:amino acid adenylation domain-containing protein
MSVTVDVAVPVPAEPATGECSIRLPLPPAVQRAETGAPARPLLRDLASALLAALVFRYTRQEQIEIEALPLAGDAGPARSQPLDLEGFITGRALVRRAQLAWATPGRSAAAGAASEDRVAREVRLVLPRGLVEALSPARLDPTGATPATPASAAVTLTFVDESNALRVELTGDAGARDPAAAARMLEHLRRLAEGVLAQPDAHLAALPMLSDGEYQEIVSAWNATDRPYVVQCCIHEAFEKQVATTPDAPALVSGAVTLLYRELNARANQLAGVLVARGVGPEVLVGIALPDRLEATIALLAILKAGGAYVPLDPTSPRQRLQDIIEDARLTVVVTTSAVAERLPMPLEAALCIDLAAAQIAAQGSGNLPCRATPENAAYVIYTSGSTGKPKGVLGLHRTIVSALTWASTYVSSESAWNKAIEPARVCCLSAPISFGSAVMGLLLPLLGGAKLVLVPEGEGRDLTQLVDIWARYGVSRLVFVPPHLRQLLAMGPGVTSRLSAVNSVGLSGATLTPDVAHSFFEAFPDARLTNAYSATEVGTMSTMWHMTRDEPLRGMSIGRPIGNTRVYVLDPSFNPVPVWAIGEICVESADMTRGYVSRPGLTADRFIPNPFGAHRSSRLYRTGDLGRFFATGDIEFLGRGDHQVKVRGVRIELGEIEAALAEHPDVSEAVVGTCGDTDETKLAAYIVAASGRRPSVAAMREFLGTRIPDYMIPAYYVTLEKLPLTPRGKIDRFALPPPGTGRPQLDTPYTPPRTPVERRLAEIWQRVLSLDDIGVDDHFLELGGDSLTATRVVGEIKAAFGVELSVASLFSRPTVTQLSHELVHA